MLVRSSALVAADVLVRGVPAAELPPLTDPLGVDVEVDIPLALAEPFAAFSANRFCFDAEGGIIDGSVQGEAEAESDRFNFLQVVEYKYPTPP